MKEIDLLPEWYKSGRRRQISYRTQYVALGGILVVMMVWNFIAAHSRSKAIAEVTANAAKQTKAESVSREFAKIKNEITQLQKKAKSLDEIDSKIDVASILAELSFLIDEKVVLSKVEFIAEGFEGEQESKTNASSVVRIAGARSGENQTSLVGDIRFKVIIRGVATDASDVAELICKLEDSPYFCMVYPSFSRNAKVKVGANPAEENHQVSEFEIGCYLANYKGLNVNN
jgi:Tfp pilus assembly protein PilN